MPQPPIGETSQCVAANVRRIRSERGLTIEQLADLVRSSGHQMAAATLGKIERGERRVDVDDAVGLAMALGAPLAALFAEDADELVEQVGAVIDGWAAMVAGIQGAMTEAHALRQMEEMRWFQLVEMASASGEARAMIESELVAHPLGGMERVEQLRQDLEATAADPTYESYWKLTSPADRREG